MKVLIITYYWPPAGGSGVQRWLKFVKYLQDFGVEPVIYTVANPNYPLLDSSLVKDVPNGITILKKPIREPNNILSLFKKDKAKQSAGFLDPNPNLIGKLLQYVRANYFIPDARKYWIQPSVKYLKSYLKENKVDAIITSGPPHSLHLIGMQLKQELGVKWISDFRDPWTEIDYFEQLPLTKKARAKHFQLEKKVLKNSDAVLVIGKTMKTKFDAFSKNVKVVTNGYDSDLNTGIENLDSKFTITHVGLMNADRNPISFWQAISDLSSENKEFGDNISIKIVGKVAEEVKDSIQKYGIQNIYFEGYLSHDEVRKFQQKSQVLLVAVNNVKSAKGIITGKIFEYLQAKRPILAIGPQDGDLAEIIHKTKSGEIVDFNQVSELKDVIWSMYQLYKKGRLESTSVDIEKYHRKELTKELVNIIMETIS